MRATILIAAFAAVLLVPACSPAAPPVEEKPATTQTSTADQAATLPSDVPVPIGLEGRRDSNQPGTQFFVVQGQLQSTLPEAGTAIRQQAEDAGWTVIGDPAPSADGSTETLTFEKDARTIRVTLVKVQNTVTGMNLLTGPK